MKLNYTLGKDYSMENVEFEGLNGREYVTSTKDALNVMKIDNPAIEFGNKSRNGDFDDMSDEEYYEMLDTVKCITALWLYPGEREDNPSMNILSLLANAITLLSQQAVELRKYRGCKDYGDGQ